jgi:hypothetical protein
MTTIDSARAALAERIGERPEAIAITYLPKLSVADLRRGVTVDLQITRWRGKAKLTAEDLGLSAQEEAERRVVDAWVELGEKRLIRREATNRLAAIESEARVWLRQCSYPTIWGHFVPETGYARWKERNERYRRSYLDTAEQIGEQWDDMLADLRLSYGLLARQAWRRLAQAGADVGAEQIWVEQFVDRTMGLLPTRDGFLASVSFQVDLGYVPIPADLDELIEELERSVADGAGTASEMRRDLLRATKRRRDELLERFSADVQAAFATMAYEIAVNILEAIKRNDGKLPGASAVQLRGLVEQVRAMQWWDDAALEEQIARIERQLDMAGPRRSLDEVRDALQEIGREARYRLLVLDRRPERSGRDVGIPDDLTLLAERRERRTRPLDVEPVTPAMGRGRRSGSI